MKSVFIFASILLLKVRADTALVDAVRNNNFPKPAAGSKPLKKAASKKEVSWSNKTTEVRVVKGSSGAATKGAGMVSSSSGWGGSHATAQGSEGSITNAKFSANRDVTQQAWGKEKDGKKTSTWIDNFGKKESTKGNSKAAHEGEGKSTASSTHNSSSGSAIGTRGSAANSDFKKASDDWRDTFVDNRDGKNKQKSFVQKFANKQIGSTNAKAIGYGDSSANAKTTIKKAANSAEGQAGAQSSTAAKYQGDNWHAA